MSDVVWEPGPEVLDQANVVRLMRRHGIDAYRELVRRSQDDPEWFWPAAIEDLELEFSTPWEPGHGPLARARVGDVVRGRQAEHRVELRAPLGGAPARRGGRRLRGRERGPARGDVRGDVRRGDAPGRGARRARRRRGGHGRDLPPHVARGGDRLARVRAPGRDPGAGLLRLRRARRRRAATGLRGEGGHHRRRLAAARARASDEGRRGRGARGVAVGRARRRLAPARRRRSHAGRPRRLLGRAGRAAAGRAGAARGGLRDAVPPHLHVGHDRPAEGDRPRAGRLSRVDHARGRLPGRRAPRGHDPLLHGHGLDHGPVDGGRRRRGRLDARLHGGRAGLAGRPPVDAVRAGARHRARLLAHADPRAHAARRADGGSLVAAHDRHDRRAVEPRPVPLALRARRRRPLSDHQLLRRNRGRRVLPLADAGRADQGVLARRPRARHGHGRRGRRTATPCAARSASSSAASRSPG